MSSVVRVPLSARIWRRCAYALLAFPVGTLAIVGGPGAATRVQRGLAARLVEADGAPAGVRRPLARWLVTLPLNAVAFTLTAFLAFNTVRNVGYPLINPLPGDWGGPTLAGRWAVHGLGWLPFLYVGLVLVAWLTRWQARLAR